MLNISSILKHIGKGVEAKDPRYHVLNDEHVLDSKTGVELHMYDDWFKATYKDEVIATMPDFTKNEQEVLWSIKQLVSNPEKVKYINENYTTLQKARREKLAALFESPTPIETGVPVEEAEATEYLG